MVTNLGSIANREKAREQCALQAMDKRRKKNINKEKQ